MKSGDYVQIKDLSTVETVTLASVFPKNVKLQIERENSIYEDRFVVVVLDDKIEFNYKDGTRRTWKKGTKFSLKKSYLEPCLDKAESLLENLNKIVERWNIK